MPAWRYQYGAVGPTGITEKELTLAISLKLQKALEKEGARVIMTRTKREFFDNHERILFYRDSLPDLLVSIHLNSSDDPLGMGGTGAFYRYVGFRNLSRSIYKRMLELGLAEYGNTGSFNFMLNSPTEYPNALVETLFLSNPEEEMKVLDPKFQQQSRIRSCRGSMISSKAPNKRRAAINMLIAACGMLFFFNFAFLIIAIWLKPSLQFLLPLF
jgi:N-acetylmuramoyl-L-alanine amidase